MYSCEHYDIGTNSNYMVVYSKGNCPVCKVSSANKELYLPLSLSAWAGNMKDNFPERILLSDKITTQWYERKEK